MFIRLLTLLVVLTTVVCSAIAQNTILGILEDVPGTYSGEKNHRAVRIVFEKSGREWKPFPSYCPDSQCLSEISSEYPAQVTWTVGFDGKDLGRITTQNQKDFGIYSHIGLQQITSQGAIPTIREQSRQFSGFLEAPVYRPLVANSQPHVKDPELWKPAQLPPESIHLLREQFRRQFPKLCRSNKDEDPLPPFPYRSEQIKLVKAYASKTGWVVARLHLGDAIDCDDTEAGFEIDDKWFVIDPQKSTHYLDEGMWLVDAGDYDNDGKSELMFSIDRYNRGGYELFYDNFQKHARFEFSYH